jgi:hypothetical protein
MHWRSGRVNKCEYVGLTPVCPQKWANAKNSFRVGESFAVLNAGLIEIDWEQALLSLSVINAQGDKLLEHKVPFSELVIR